MGQQNGINVSPEVMSALQKQAEQIAKSGASVNEVMSAVDALRQAFLDIYAKEALKVIKTIKH